VALLHPAPALLSNHRRRLPAGSAAVCAALLLLFAAAARADSIVYIKDHNVWVSTPDGHRERQVTTDGTAGLPYTSPSQARDGTIVALRGFKFHRLSQTGQRLAPPFEPGAAPPVADPDVSPDGSKLAYWTTIWCGQELCSRTLFSYADRYTPPEQLDDGSGGLIEPSWLDDRRVVVANQGLVWIDEIGAPEEFHWFHELAFSQVNDVDVAASGDRLALVGGTNWEYLAVYVMPGPPPARPQLTCVWQAEPHEGRFDDPTWSPDGSKLAFALRDGVYVMTGLRDLTDCSRLQGPLVVRGASEPDWGPAGVTATTAPGGGPADTQAPAVRLSLARGQTRKTLRRRGLVVRIAADERIAGRLAVGVRGHARRKAFRSGRGGTARVTVRLPRVVGRRLARGRRARIAVEVVASDAAGNRTRASRSFRIPTGGAR